MRRQSSRSPAPPFALLALAACLSGCGGDAAVTAIVSGTGGGPERFRQSPHLIFDGSQAQILSVDIRQLRGFPAWEKIYRQIRANAETSAWLDDVKTHLGVDPVTDVERVVVALHPPWNRDDVFHNAIFVFIGKFGAPDSVAEGMHKLASAHTLDDMSPFAASDRNGVAVYSSMAALSKKDPTKTMDMHLAFPLEGVMLVSRDLGSIGKALDVIGGRAPDLSASVAWKDQLARASLGSAVWAVGDFPKEVNDWIKEQSAVRPELDKLLFLNRSVSMNLSFKYDGRDYVFETNLKCAQLREAAGMAEDLKKARERGALPKLVEEYLGAGDPRIPIWVGLMDAVQFSSQTDSTILSLRRTRAEMDQFLDNLLSPPDPAAAEESAGSSGSSSPFDE